MAFNVNLPYEEVEEESIAFDPTQSFEVIETGTTFDEEGVPRVDLFAPNTMDMLKKPSETFSQAGEGASIQAKRFMSDPEFREKTAQDIKGAAVYDAGEIMELIGDAGEFISKHAGATPASTLFNIVKATTEYFQGKEPKESALGTGMSPVTKPITDAIQESGKSLMKTGYEMADDPDSATFGVVRTLSPASIAVGKAPDVVRGVKSAYKAGIQQPKYQSMSMDNLVQKSSLGDDVAKEELAKRFTKDSGYTDVAEKEGFDLPADVGLDRAKMDEETMRASGLVTGARSITGSQPEAQFKTQAIKAATRADNILNELGATDDLSVVSEGIKTNIDDTIKKLASNEDVLYNRTYSQIPDNLELNLANTKKVARDILKKYKGSEEVISPIEKKILNIASKDSVNFATADKLRQDIGQAYSNAGEYKDANAYIRSKIYNALKDDQNKLVESKFPQYMSDELAVAKKSTQKRKALEDQQVAMFGKDLSKSITPKLKRALTSGKKGDIGAFNDIARTLDNVPPEMAEQAMMSALKDMSQGAKGFSFANYAKTYKGLRDNSEVYKNFIKYAGEDKHKKLNNLYKISKGMKDIEILHTGKAATALDSLTTEGTTAKVLRFVAGRLPNKFGLPLKFDKFVDYVVMTKQEKSDEIAKLFNDKQFQNMLAKHGKRPEVDEDQFIKDLMKQPIIKKQAIKDAKEQGINPQEVIRNSIIKPPKVQEQFKRETVYPDAQKPGFRMQPQYPPATIADEIVPPKKSVQQESLMDNIRQLETMQKSPLFEEALRNGNAPSSKAKGAIQTNLTATKVNRIRNGTPTKNDLFDLEADMEELRRLDEEETAMEASTMFSKGVGELIAGSIAGVETDENGNITLDPTAFVAGMGGYAAVKQIAKNPRVQKEIKDYARRVIDELEANPKFSYMTGIKHAVEPGKVKKGDLIIQHNLEQANLAHADKMGGLPVPSLAITNKGTPLDGYGDITLLGDEKLATPTREHRVFGADIYSPRYPTVYKNLTNKAERDISNELTDYEKTIGTYGSGIDFDNIQYNHALRAKFLKEKGIDIPIINKEIPKEDLDQYEYFRDMADRYKLNKEYNQDEEFMNRARNYYIEKGFDKDDPLLTDEKNFGRLTRSLIQNVKRISREAEKIGGVDEFKTKSAIDDLIRKNQQGYNEFVDNYLQSHGAKETIYAGTDKEGIQKYIPHTINNVIKHLQKDLRGGESGFVNKIGQLRGKLTPEFKTISDIRKHKNKLVSDAEFDKVQEELSDTFFGLSDELDKYYKYEPGFDSNERVIGIIEESINTSVEKELLDYGYVDVPKETIDKLENFKEALRNAPTEYFESKMLRKMKLGEFEYAVIPSNSSDKTKEILEKNNIEYSTYDPEEDGSRINLIKEIAEKNGYAFALPAIIGFGFAQENNRQ